jgi:hypothetical protein
MLTDSRRTGITLKERQRDEHGFEIIDGSMFESPEKSPVKPNGVGKEDEHDDDAMDQSKSMDIQESMFDLPSNNAFYELSTRFRTREIC